MTDGVSLERKIAAVLFQHAEAAGGTLVAHAAMNVTMSKLLCAIAEVNGLSDQHMLDLHTEAVRAGMQLLRQVQKQRAH